MPSRKSIRLALHILYSIKNLFSKKVFNNKILLVWDIDVTLLLSILYF